MRSEFKANTILTTQIEFRDNYKILKTYFCGILIYKKIVVVGTISRIEDLKDI